MAAKKNVANWTMYNVWITYWRTFIAKEKGEMVVHFGLKVQIWHSDSIRWAD